MNRGMIVIGVLLVGLVIAMIYQQQKGVERPWTQCRESMVTQMLTGECTPSQFSAPHMRGPLRDAPQEDTPQSEIPQGKIPQTGSYEGGWLEDM